MDENERIGFERKLLVQEKALMMLEIKHKKQVYFYQVAISILVGIVIASIATVLAI